MLTAWWVFWAFISVVELMVGGAACHLTLARKQLEEEGQLLELRLVSELGSGGVVQLAERSGSAL